MKPFFISTNRYFFFLLGWQRNLVAEGVEPNPGPPTIWAAVKEALQKSTANVYILYINKFEGWLKDEKNLKLSERKELPGRAVLQRIKENYLRTTRSEIVFFRIQSTFFSGGAFTLGLKFFFC